MKPRIFYAVALGKTLMFPQIETSRSAARATAKERNTPPREDGYRWRVVRLAVLP